VRLKKFQKKSFEGLRAKGDSRIDSVGIVFVSLRLASLKMTAIQANVRAIGHWPVTNDPALYS
jgi:hypothetical protein